MNSCKKVIRHGNSYDINFIKKNKPVKCVLKNNQPECSSPGLGYRHLAALLGFLLCSLVSMHRQALGVSIVAMVNQTERAHKLDRNFTASCSELSVLKENSTRVKTDGEFSWNSQLQGNIIAISFFGYLFTNIFSGRIAEVWGAKRTLVCGNLLAALCTALSPLAARYNPYALIALQFARGLSQGFTFSPLYVLMANWFPRSERGPLSTFVVCGFSGGALLGGLASGAICDTLAWAASFYITSCFSVIITLVFLLTYHDLPHHHPHISKEELLFITTGQENDMSTQRPPVPWKKMFTSVPVYALFIGMFGSYWSLNHFMSVHPTFMGTILQYSMTENGMLTSLPYSIRIIGALAASFVSVWFIKRDLLTVDKVRKSCSSVGAFGFASCLVGVIFSRCNRTTNILFFSFSHFFLGMWLSGIMIACGDMTPVFAGSLASVSSTISGGAAAVMPVLVGALTKNETLEEWHHVFYMHIAVVLSSGIVFQAFGSAEIQPWNSTPVENVEEEPSEEISKISAKDFTYTNHVSTEELNNTSHM